MAKKRKKGAKSKAAQNRSQNSTIKDSQGTSNPKTEEEKRKALRNKIEASVKAEIKKQKIEELLLKRTLSEVLGGNPTNLNALTEIFKGNFESMVSEATHLKVFAKDSVPELSLKLVSTIEKPSSLTTKKKKKEN